MFRKIHSLIKDQVFASKNDGVLKLERKQILLLTGLEALSNSISAFLLDFNMITDNKTFQRQRKINAVGKIFEDIKADIEFLLKAVQKRKDDQKIEQIYLIQDSEKYEFYLAYKRKESIFWKADRIVFCNYKDPARPVRMNIIENKLELNNMFGFYKYDVDPLINYLEKMIEIMQNKILPLFINEPGRVAIKLREINAKLVS